MQAPLKFCFRIKTVATFRTTPVAQQNMVTNRATGNPQPGFRPSGCPKLCCREGLSQNNYKAQGKGLVYKLQTSLQALVPGYLFAVRGEPEFIRSDNGPEFASNAVKKWLKSSGVKTLFVAPGSPWAQKDHVSYQYDI